MVSNSMACIAETYLPVAYSAWCECGSFTTSISGRPSTARINRYGHFAGFFSGSTAMTSTEGNPCRVRDSSAAASPTTRPAACTCGGTSTTKSFVGNLMKNLSSPAEIEKTPLPLRMCRTSTGCRAVTPAPVRTSWATTWDSSLGGCTVPCLSTYARRGDQLHHAVEPATSSRQTTRQNEPVPNGHREQRLGVDPRH